MVKFIIGKDETFEGTIMKVETGTSQYGARYEITLKDKDGKEKVLMCPKKDIVSSRSLLATLVQLNADMYSDTKTEEWIGAVINVKGDGTRRNITIVSKPAKQVKIK